VSAVQIRCSTDDVNGALLPAGNEDDGIIRIFLVYRQGRFKKILRELSIEEDNPYRVHGNSLLQAYPVQMLEQDIEADMTFVAKNTVRSVVFLQYSPPNHMQDAGNNATYYWLWTEDRKVLVEGVFDFPSVDIDAFISEGGLPISTFNQSAVLQINPVNLPHGDENSSVEEHDDDRNLTAAVDLPETDGFI
jgi:hypothetical protein